MAEYDSGDIVIDPKELLEGTGIAMTICRYSRRPAPWRASDRRYGGDVSGRVRVMIH